MGARHGVNDEVDLKEVEISYLFLLMGASLNLVNEVPAGNIVGIGGLEDYVLKTGTLSSHPHCPNMTKIKAISSGLIKVAIEPVNLADMDKLKIGLQKLDRSDPSV